MKKSRSRDSTTVWVAFRLVSRRQMAVDSGAGWDMAGPSHLSVTSGSCRQKDCFQPGVPAVPGTHVARRPMDIFNAETNPPNLNPRCSWYPQRVVSGRITDGKHWDDKPRWSPDGKTIYFVSRPGGFFNVWGIHFDPAAGKPIGQPFQVSKFDSPRLMIPQWIGPVGLSLTQDKLVLTVAQASGNIWVLDNVD